MKLITKDSYFAHYFDADNSLFASVVYPETEQMSDEEYRANINELVGLFDEKQPLLVLGDMKDMNFPISPETQEWLNESLFACYNRIPMKRLALVVSDDIFTAVSTEQAVEDAAPEKYEVRYFQTFDEAKNWLLS